MVKGPKPGNAPSESVKEPVSESKTIPSTSTVNSNSKPKPKPNSDSKPKPKAGVDNYEEYAKNRSKALDQCFVDERGGKVIEGNEVLARGEWLSVKRDKQQKGEMEDEEHYCAFCGKENVK